MDRPGHETDKGAVAAMTAMSAQDFGPRAAVTSFMAFLLAYGACANAQSQGRLIRRDP